MSIASYSDLKTAVKNWVNDNNLDSYIPDFITLAEKRVYRENPIQGTIATLSDTISSGVLSVPSDFLEFTDVYILSNSKAYSLKVRTTEYIIDRYPTRSSDAMPAYIARDGSNFIFGPYPDQNYTVNGSYYKMLSALTTTNVFTSDYMDLLFYVSMKKAEQFVMNDERANMWEAEYQNAKIEVRKQENRTRFNGSPKRSVAR